MKTYKANRTSPKTLLGVSLSALALTLALTGCEAAPNLQEEAAVSETADQEQLNILMVLLDDLGYSDLGAYGGEVETPNIDALIADGTQFTNFHTAPLCAPTRAALMTGQHPHKVGLGSMEGLTPPGVPTSTPGYRGSLEGNFEGIAEVLSETGYETYQVGKWHLGGESGQTPQDLGFDENFTLYDAGASYFSDGLRLFPRPVEPVNTAIHERNGEPLKSLPEDFFSTRSYTDEMIQMLERNEGSDDPFFGYLAYTAPHDPLHVENDALIEKYEELYLSDYNFEELRDLRIKRMEDLGLIDENIDTRWLESSPAWEDLDNEQRTDLAHRMAVYGAVLHETDQHIGRLVTYLKETDQYDNTLIVLASDNGPSASTQDNYARIAPGVPEWYEQNYPLSGSVDSYGAKGSFPSAGLPNAQVSSGPYFQAKNTLFEGGTRVPAAIKPPKISAANKPELVGTFAHITDLYPTFADYAGVDVASLENLAGDSIKPLLDGKTEEIGDDEFGMEHFGQRAYRAGDWKLVFVPAAMGGSDDYALYNLAKDPGEVHNVIADHPAIADELARKWTQHAEENGIVIVDFAEVNDLAPDDAEAWYSIDWASNTEPAESSNND